MEDFEYKGVLCMYLPHPKLIGNYEISTDDKFIGRYNTRKECRKAIDQHIKKPKLKRYVAGNWLRSYFEGEFESLETAWAYLSRRFLISYPSPGGRHIGLWVELENEFGFKQLNICKEDVTDLNELPEKEVLDRCKNSICTRL